MWLNKEGYQQSQNGHPQSLRLSFREAAAADMPRIMDIFAKSFSDQIPQEEFPGYADRFARHINSLTSQFTVAAQNGRVVGFSIVSTQSNCAYLDAIGVDPHAQHSGVGKGLMQEAEKTTARFGKPQLAFHVRRNNISGLQFYDRLGYRAVAIQPRYYDWDGMDAVIMTKPVAAQAQNNRLYPATQMFRR
jgi:ribosomal protein S18 acetylase RimI-like enzyme